VVLPWHEVPGVLNRDHQLVRALRSLDVVEQPRAAKRWTGTQLRRRLPGGGDSRHCGRVGRWGSIVGDARGSCGVLGSVNDAPRNVVAKLGVGFYLGFVPTPPQPCWVPNHSSRCRAFRKAPVKGDRFFVLASGAGP